MSPGTDSVDGGKLLAELGREIRRPLDSFRESIAATLADPQGGFSDAQRGYLASLNDLCDEMLVLIAKHLGGDDPTIAARSSMRDEG